MNIRTLGSKFIIILTGGDTEFLAKRLKTIFANSNFLLESLNQHFNIKSTMIKNLLIIAACLLLSVVSFAQQGAASPYSYYGIGDVGYKGTAEIRSMAGIAVEQDSIHLNIDNPASYSNLKPFFLHLGFL
jgi:hypothetical protein